MTGPLELNLAQLVQDVTDVLAEAPGDWQVFDHIKESLVPPCAVVGQDDPWLDDGEVFGDVQLKYTIDLVVPNGTNAEMTSQLFAVVAVVYPALRELGYSLSVARPTTLKTSGGQFLSTVVSITSTTQL